MLMPTRETQSIGGDAKRRRKERKACIHLSCIVSCLVPISIPISIRIVDLIAAQRNGTSAA